MNKTLLAMTPATLPVLTIPPESRERRDELVLDAAKIVKVANAEQLKSASDALKELKDFTRTIEDARKTVGAPVLELTKSINSLAKELTVACEEQATRLSKLVGDYNAEQARIAERERQAAWEEEQRILRETQEKLDAAAAAGASQAKLDKIEDKAFTKLAVAKANTAAAVAPKVAGIATQEVTCFEVTNVHELYKANPMFVTLTPNKALITAALKSGPLAGVRSWKENKAIVRG